MDDEKLEIKRAIRLAILSKLENFKPETEHAPFHTRLLGEDRWALYRFIHSLNTTFGTSVFEPVAVAIARQHFDNVQRSYDLGSKIRSAALVEVNSIVNELTIADEGFSDKRRECERVRIAFGSSNHYEKTTARKADLRLQRGDEIYLIDIKTVKPNVDSIEKYKATCWFGTQWSWNGTRTR